MILTSAERTSLLNLLRVHGGSSSELTQVMDKLSAPDKSAYLVLITWPDGTEGLLFPRPGNVAVAYTEEAGRRDFETAKRHLNAYTGSATDQPKRGILIRLFEFERGSLLEEYTV